MDKKKKVVYQLDTPYSTVSWPNVNLEDQETILEILCTLLEPLGQHRSKYVQPSKGQRDKKRKRKTPNVDFRKFESPPPPEIRPYVDVGLTTVTRRLQEMASKAHGMNSNLEDKSTGPETSSSSYSAIFVARSGQSNILNGHFPQMVAVASKSNPSKMPIRLVGLSKSCEDRLSESLCIPRVSCIGLYEGAPNSKALVEFARQHVPPVELHWLQDARQAEYRETNINTIETSIGNKKPKSHKPSKP
ncbi:hypothetical protein F4805DRAFT_170494 [Annulohypoxylon moriforme]|nr:hypothetical protein F4805DRAFT_170494 [Annulohypoxylon moriforme]